MENADVGAGKLGQGGIEEADVGRLEGCDEGLVTGGCSSRPPLWFLPLYGDREDLVLTTSYYLHRLGSPGRPLTTSCRLTLRSPS